MVGLHSGTHSKLAVIGGILTIALADAFSDALGIHISEESEGRHASREIWESTIFTFSSKLVFALTFLIPVLLLELSTAVVVGIVWGLLVLSLLSYRIAREQKGSPWKVVSEHLIVALVVIVAAHYVGDWLSLALG